MSERLERMIDQAGAPSPRDVALGIVTFLMCDGDEDFAPAIYRDEIEVIEARICNLMQRVLDEKEG